MSEKYVEALIDEIRELKTQAFHLRSQLSQMYNKQRMHLATEVLKVVIPQLGTLDTPDDVTDYAFRVADAMLERAKK